MPRIGILGGSFDPVHIGHLIIACLCQEQLGLDTVLFVPARRPPHKLDQHLAPGAARLRMLKLAIGDRPGLAVSTIELDNIELRFTADTLKALTQRHSGAELFFLMGSDSLRDLHTWRDPEVITALARLGVARRPSALIDLERLMVEQPYLLDRVSFVDIPLIGVSSTEIRDRVRNQRTIAYQVPEAVEAYIVASGLYRE